MGYIWAIQGGFPLKPPLNQTLLLKLCTKIMLSEFCTFTDRAGRNCVEKISFGTLGHFSITSNSSGVHIPEYKKFEG